MPRAIQLVDYYTKKPAPEADRIRIQAKIDELQTKLDREECKSRQTSLNWSIGCLRGNYRMPRG